MSNALEVAKISTRGTFNLFWGTVISSFISAAGTIVLVRLLQPSEYGLYAIALIPPIFLGLFRDWGVNAAIIRYVAHYRSQGNFGRVRDVLIVGVVFEALSGVLLSLTTFFIADPLAIFFFRRPEIARLIQLSAFIVLTSAILTAAQSIFIGYERMEFYSVTMIISAAVKSLLSPLLVLLGFSVFGAVTGYFAGYFVAGFGGLLIVIVFFYRRLTKAEETQSFKSTLRMLLSYGFPLSISTIVSGFLLQFYAFLMPIFCSDFMIGNYQAAVSFSVLIGFFAMPISTALFPTFSKISSEKNFETLSSVFRFSVKYAALMVVPATALVISVAPSLVFALFGRSYEYTPLFLSFYVIIFLLSAFGNLSVTNFINGQGKTVVTFKLGLLTLGAGLPLSILIPLYGIIGLISATIVSALPALLLGLWWINRNYGVAIDFNSSLKILIASGLAGVPAWTSANLLSISYFASLFLGAGIFLICLFFALRVLRAVDKVDIENLRGMVVGLGVVSKIANFVFRLYERTL